MVVLVTRLKIVAENQVILLLIQEAMVEEESPCRHRRDLLRADGVHQEKLVHGKLVIAAVVEIIMVVQGRWVELVEINNSRW